MEFYYVTKYPIQNCIQYLYNKNVNDVFEYQFEEVEGGYYLTFVEYRNSLRSLQNCIKPCFNVMFYEQGNETLIKVIFVESSFVLWPNLYLKKMDEFWDKKLDAKLLANTKS